MNKLNQKECENKDCAKSFAQFRTTDKYCSAICLIKCKTPNLKSLKPIKKVSDKRKIENLKYSVLRIEFLGKKENRICPITGKETTEIHHKRGRIGILFLETKFWLAVSREGHVKIENNPEWAKEHGYSFNRLYDE
jgi:hypothetical protein